MFLGRVIVYDVRRNATARIGENYGKNYSKPNVVIATYPILLIHVVLFQGLAFQKINRIITAVDSQPMFDGGVLINVLGRLQVSGIKNRLLYSLYDVIDRRRYSSCVHANVCSETDPGKLLCATRHF